MMMLVTKRHGVSKKIRQDDKVANGQQHTATQSLSFLGEGRGYDAVFTV